MKSQSKTLRIMSVFAFLFTGFIFMQKLNAQQKFWVPADPPRAYYKIDARINIENHVVEGKESVILKNTSARPISVLAFEWTISNIQSIEVKIKGKPLPLWNPVKNPPIPSPLLYELSKPLKPGKRVELDVEFKAWNLISGDFQEIKFTNWFPRLWWDGLPTHDEFKIKIDVPSGYALAASGLLNRKTGYYENKGVRTFGIYMGKGLKTEKREVDGVCITSLFTEKGSECALLCLETAEDVVQFYKKWLGFYPFKFLYVIPGASRPMGGYPFASGIVVIHGQEQFDKRPLEFWKWITAHEVGHQYWGEFVLDDDMPSWLWIGLGIYADREYTLFRNPDKDMHTRFFSRYFQGLKKGYDTTIDIPPAQFRKIRFDHNNIVKHGKGFSVISALENYLGKETFMRVYKKCLKDYGGKRLGYKEFWRVCEKVSGENMKWFFDQWVRSNKYLSCQVESQESKKEEDRFISSITVRSSGSLKMPVPVKAVFEDGTSQIQFTSRIFEVSNLRFESDSKLKEVILDPDKKLAMLETPISATSEDLSEIISQLPWSGAGEGALRAFKKAKSVKLEDFGLWFKLGLTLFDGSYYKESFEAFRKVIELNPPKMTHFSSLVWMGHLKDLEGSREEALKYYREALKYDTGGTQRHDQWGMRINRKWVEERLKTPFKWGKDRIQV